VSSWPAWRASVVRASRSSQARLSPSIETATAPPVGSSSPACLRRLRSAWLPKRLPCAHENVVPGIDLRPEVWHHRPPEPHPVERDGSTGNKVEPWLEEPELRPTINPTGPVCGSFLGSFRRFCQPLISGGKRRGQGQTLLPPAPALAYTHTGARAKLVLGVEAAKARGAQV
jgi:hypothetical protein